MLQFVVWGSLLMFGATEGYSWRLLNKTRSVIVRFIGVNSKQRNVVSYKISTNWETEWSDLACHFYFLSYYMFLDCQIQLDTILVNKSGCSVLMFKSNQSVHICFELNTYLLKLLLVLLKYCIYYFSYVVYSISISLNFT